ncbi:RCC1 repeat-containing protein C10F6.04 [Ceratocystis lukuohia]|uniref:RCC1 repeat-containing protein C10F6.04 n=1 Tax=Ceratocystis lukuohia TaxID=2019550 RepID=A0ABR4MIL0_9PEZI
MAIFALGSNGNGQLGIGHFEDVSVPQLSLFASPPDGGLEILSAAFGGNHSLLLLKNPIQPSIEHSSPPGACVYCSGLATIGACGLNSPADKVANFRPLMAFASTTSADSREADSATPTHIAATWEASVLVFDRVRVYTLGSGSKGELALGSLPAEILRSASATRVPDFPPSGTEIVDLVASMAHVLVVLDDGRVFGWGNGRKGQLGEPADAVVKSPRQVFVAGDADFKAIRAVAGKEFSVLLDARGRVAVLGGEKWEIKSSAPAVLPDCIDIRAGWGNVYALHADGKLTAWGRNDHGQLPPADLPAISRIAVGSEHVVCLTKEGKDVISWGWGEHGNCGPGVDDKGDFKNRYNIIASHKNIAAEAEIGCIAAGCATSWINITSVKM